MQGLLVQRLSTRPFHCVLPAEHTTRRAFVVDAVGESLSVLVRIAVNNADPLPELVLAPGYVSSPSVLKPPCAEQENKHEKESRSGPRFPLVQPQANLGEVPFKAGDAFL